MPESFKSILRASLDEMIAATDVLNSYIFVALKDNQDLSRSSGIASVIGFSGTQIRGSLVLSCGRELLTKSHPNNAMGMPIADLDIIDWAGELANQMLGRVKNKAAGCGAVFSMSIPTTMSGEKIEVSKPKEAAACEITYQGGFGVLSVQFVAIIDPALKIVYVAEKDSGTKEGATILF